jgi:alpha-D-ribose 1-methylphosphonate 5-triphosphate synthase subunit PhnG
MVMGYAPDRALAAAVLDAAAEAHIAHDELEAILREAVAAAEEREAQLWRRLAPTRVQFDEIPE